MENAFVSVEETVLVVWQRQAKNANVIWEV
jgi:hypothetical protein